MLRLISARPLCAGSLFFFPALLLTGCRSGNTDASGTCGALHASRRASTKATLSVLSPDAGTLLLRIEETRRIRDREARPKIPGSAAESPVERLGTISSSSTSNAARAASRGFTIQAEDSLQTSKARFVYRLT